MKGKLIVIEGTDCSGKETQAKMLTKRLEKNNIACVKLCFPNYDSPTGKIVGGPYLGKSYICNGWFSEGASNVDPKVSSLYYAADRKYNVKNIEQLIDKGINVILDRYSYSNLAHQGGKIKNKEERFEMYKWLNTLEFELLELPKADIKVFLHMSYEASCELKKNREECPDEHEMSKEYLLLAENAYLEIAELYSFKTIECSVGNIPRSIEDIHNEIYEYIDKQLKNL